MDESRPAGEVPSRRAEHSTPSNRGARPVAAETARAASQPLAVGDRVVLRRVGFGTVVGIIDLDAYASGLDSASWKRLHTGVLIQLTDGSFRHVREPSSLLRRTPAGDPG